MGGRRIVAAVASAVLAAPAGPALAAQPGGPGAGPVPCPVAELDPPPQRPPPPEPPPYAPGDRELGGPLLASPGLVVPPGAGRVPGGQLSATSWLVADLGTGAVLGGCGPHRHGIPASTQKLLLAAALLDELDPDTTVTVTRQDLAIEPGSSAVGLVAGGEYRVETLWLGLLLNSGNDAANVLARLGGGEAGLAGGLRAMNLAAERLGAYQTQAATPSGLDGPGQFTSAYDLALIARAVFARADFRRYIATERARIPAQPGRDSPGFQIQNQNDLLAGYPGALGGKTGYTDLARHSFVGAAQRGDRRLVVTLLGAEARPQRSWRQAAALLDWGFAQPRDAAVGRLVEPAELARRAVSSTLAPEPSPVLAGAPERPAEPAGAGGRPAAGPPALAGWLVAAAGLVGLVTALLLAKGRRRRSGTVTR